MTAITVEQHGSGYVVTMNSRQSCPSGPARKAESSGEGGFAMLSRTTRIASASLLSAAVVLAAVSTAEAGRRHHRHHGHGWETGAAIVGGLAAGALIGSALSAPRYPAPVYVAPPPPPVYHHRPAPRVYYQQPAPVHYRPAPWSPAWYQYCSSRYRSFDPRTGYFRSYSGRYVFCQ